MKTIQKGIGLLFVIALISCGGKDKEKKEEGFSVQRKKAPTEQPVETTSTNEVKASERVDMTTKGVGPIGTKDPGMGHEHDLEPSGNGTARPFGQRPAAGVQWIAHVQPRFDRRSGPGHTRIL